MSAEDIARKSIKVASDICVFTNNNITVEKVILLAAIPEALLVPVLGLLEPAVRVVVVLDHQIASINL